jgi:hypothetical protein
MAHGVTGDARRFNSINMLLYTSKRRKLRAIGNALPAVDEGEDVTATIQMHPNPQ